MRINQTKRIYMNEADAGSGNGAQAAPPVTAEPTAAPTAPALDADALLSRFASVVDERIAASEARIKNSTFAELRKGGHLKQEKPQDAASQLTPSAPAAAQAGLSMADVEALLERENVIATRAAKHGLNEAQARRLKSALSNVPRESFATEADSYLADMGLVKSQATPQPAAQQQAQATPAPAKPNISDRGAAAPVDSRDHNGVLNSRPLEITGHDMDQLTIEHGHDKGLQMFQERALAALSRIRIKPPRG